MKIERVVAHPLAAKAPKPVSFSIGDYSTFYGTLVEVTTDEGVTGVGESIARKAPRVVAAVVDDLLTAGDVRVVHAGIRADEPEAVLRDDEAAAVPVDRHGLLQD